LIGGTFYGQSVMTVFDQVRAGQIVQQTTRYTPLTSGVRAVYLGACVALLGGGLLVMFGPVQGEA
jgi:hypothetical protein